MSADNLRCRVQVLAQQLREMPRADSANCYRRGLYQAILDRAERARPAVARRLLDRYTAEIQAFVIALPPTVETTARPQRNSTAQLKALIQSLEPAAVSPDRTAVGSEFDDYLREQETQILQAWSTQDEVPADSEIDTATADVRSDTGGGEMRAARRLRTQRLKYHADNLVNRALADAPEDPGPLNPQMLAIKALANMRDLSPHYLNRFVSYIDTVLYLEAMADNDAAPAKKPPRKRR